LVKRDESAGERVLMAEQIHLTLRHLEGAGRPRPDDGSRILDAQLISAGRPVSAPLILIDNTQLHPGDARTEVEITGNSNQPLSLP